MENVPQPDWKQNAQAVALLQYCHIIPCGQMWRFAAQLLMATGRAPPPHFALQWRDAYLDCVLSFRPKHEWRHANSRQLFFLNFAQKNKQTFGYANKWLYFFCRVQTFTDCTSRPSATGTWPQDAPALVVCVASYTRFMDCFPCRFCVPAAVLEHTSAKWRFICEWNFFWCHNNLCDKIGLNMWHIWQRVRRPTNSQWTMWSKRAAGCPGSCRVISLTICGGS